jgi:uncharacterized lipoprotein YddW (UPF0748 family)
MIKIAPSLATILCLVLIINASAQTEPKRELRSVWVASVSNIDWPKYADRDKPEQQKAELIRMLELYKSTNLNAIFLQVRPECDALYKSAYEPWSRFLTWAQGTDPGYDPLQFAIDEAHKRGIEVHAWLNPYRINASTSDGGSYYSEKHIFKEHPEWAIIYDSGKKILNPGKPEVMSYIGSVVRDMVANYGLDGVHFDDYFYSYDGTPNNLDQVEYDLYANGLSRGDWRRQNVNRMIDTVYKVIQEVNPSVRFGVSPFGIYKSGVPSGIVGMDAYSQIYCDPLAWLNKGSVDYLTPQLYWPTGGGQDFETLVNWWANQVKANSRHLYSGHGTYRLSDNPSLAKTTSIDLLHESKYYFDLPYNHSELTDNLSLLESSAKGTGDPVATWTLSQIGLQIDLIRANQAKNGLGSVFFSAKDFDRVNGLADYVVQNKYTHVTLMPEMTWKTITNPLVPQNLTSISTANGDALTWEYSGSSTDRFAVYLSNETADPIEIVSNGNNLVLVTYEKQVLFSMLNFSSGSNIVVTAISPIGKESAPSLVYSISGNLPLIEIVSPNNNDTIGLSDVLAWKTTSQNVQFYLQVSLNSNFSIINYSSGWIADSSIVVQSMELEGENTYYWRVKAKTDAEGPYSTLQIFTTGFPKIPQIVSPEHLAQFEATHPTIKWDATNATSEIQVLISTVSNFATIIADEAFNAVPGQGTLSFELLKDTWYYLKIKGTNNFGTSNFSNAISFKTSAGELPVVTLVAPADNAIVASFDELQWQTSTLEGTIQFLLEVALDDQFSSIMANSGWGSTTSLKIETLSLEGNRQYFWRVKGKSEFGEGEYTSARNYTAGYPTRPEITAPVQLSENNDIKPVITWNCDIASDSIYVEFSESSAFSTLNASVRFDAKLGSGQLLSSLEEFTWYYVHLRAENEYGGSIFSSKKYFKTGKGNGIALANQENWGMVALYPNAIKNQSAILDINLNQTLDLTIKVYNVLGMEQKSLSQNFKNALGNISVELRPEDFAAKGIYFISIRAGNKKIDKNLRLIVN